MPISITYEWAHEFQNDIRHSLNVEINILFDERRMSNLKRSFLESLSQEKHVEVYS